MLDTGLSAPDRAKLRKRYGFLEFARRRSGNESAAHLAELRAQIDGRFWLHLGEGWRFFAPENYITRLTAVLDAEPRVFQVGVNFADATKLTGASAAEQTIRRAPDAGRYLLTEAMATGPAMFDTARLDRARGAHNSDPDPPTQLGDRPPRRAAHRQPRRSALHRRSGPLVKSALGPAITATRNTIEDVCSRIVAPAVHEYMADDDVTRIHASAGERGSQ